jgi:hypothetical protein
VSERRRAPLVTIADLYGTGGSVIGTRVAERLEVPLLDHVIPEEEARRTGVSEDAVADGDEEQRSRVDRLFSVVARATTSPGPRQVPDDLDHQERRLRGAIEEVLAETTRSGGVAIGCDGMVVLRTVPRALHVHLGGPRDARIEQGSGLDGIERDAAHQGLEREDKARIDYVLRAYGVQGLDPELHHLMRDSTAVPLDTCAELIVVAARAYPGQPRKTVPT